MLRTYCNTVTKRTQHVAYINVAANPRRRKIATSMVRTTHVLAAITPSHKLHLPVHCTHLLGGTSLQAQERLRRGWDKIHSHFEACYICQRLLIIDIEHVSLPSNWKPVFSHHVFLHFPLGHECQPPHSPRIYHYQYRNQGLIHFSK